MTSTAIILLSWNNREFIDRCLASLKLQSDKDFDIYFIDSGSEDGSFDYAKRHWEPEFKDRINFFNIGKNIGFTAGNNVGAKLAQEKKSYDFYVTLNVDTYTDKDWLKNLLKPFSKDEKIGIATSAIFLYEKYNIYEVSSKEDSVITAVESDLNYRKVLYKAESKNLLQKLIRFDLSSIKSNKANLFSKGKLLELPLKIKAEETYYIAVPVKSKNSEVFIDSNSDIKKKLFMEETRIIHNFGGVTDKATFSFGDGSFLTPESELNITKTEIKPDTASGCAMAIKKELLVDGKIFNEKLFSYFEDVETSENVKSKGYKIAFAHDAEVYHYMWSSTAKNLSREEQLKSHKFREYYKTRNRLLVVKKYFGILLFLYCVLRESGSIFLTILSKNNRITTLPKIKAFFEGISTTL